MDSRKNNVSFILVETMQTGNITDREAQVLHGIISEIEEAISENKTADVRKK